jgi:hypothetical protein
VKTRIRTTTLLAMTVVLAVIAAIWSVWGATPAKAIIIIGSKTGMFTLAQGEAARIHVVNTGGERGGIIPCSKVVDGDGNTLAEFRGRLLAAGEADSFLFHPPDPLPPLAVRVELTVEGTSGRERPAFIPTCEVFDTATGKTSVGQDFIIVVDT